METKTAPKFEARYFCRRRYLSSRTFEGTFQQHAALLSQLVDRDTVYADCGEDGQEQEAEFNRHDIEMDFDARESWLNRQGEIKLAALLGCNPPHPED